LLVGGQAKRGKWSTADRAVTAKPVPLPHWFCAALPLQLARRLLDESQGRSSLDDDDEADQGCTGI
jgi:hypothetical protein